MKNLWLQYKLTNEWKSKSIETYINYFNLKKIPYWYSTFETLFEKGVGIGSELLNKVMNFLFSYFSALWCQH